MCNPGEKYCEFLLLVACVVALPWMGLGHHSKADPFVISASDMMLRGPQPTGCHIASPPNPHPAAVAGRRSCGHFATAAKFLQQRMKQMNMELMPSMLGGKGRYYKMLSTSLLIGSSS